MDTYEGEQVTDQNGWSPWEASLGFQADWSPGTYMAELFIRDNQTEEVSDEATVEFDVVEN